MITDIDLLEQRCKNEYEEYINPFTDVMEAQAHINYEGAIQTSEIFELYASVEVGNSSLLLNTSN